MICRGGGFGEVLVELLEGEGLSHRAREVETGYIFAASGAIELGFVEKYSPQTINIQTLAISIHGYVAKKHRLDPHRHARQVILIVVDMPFPVRRNGF